MVPFALVQLGAENLRGYSNTSLHLRPLTILVGENNQGKSSLLKMLDWLMRTPEEFWTGDRRLDNKEFDFWYPANHTQKKARRFWIEVRFLDGRTARPFAAKYGDSILLRMAIGATDQACRLNVGPPRRGEKHDPKAAKLLQAIRSSFQLFFLPPVRDGRSSAFADKATKQVREQIRRKLDHTRQGGTTTEYRHAKQIIDKMKAIVRSNTTALVDGDSGLLATMLKESEVRLDLRPGDVFGMLEKALTVYLSTGKHDELKVLPYEVGNGLQSLVDISLSMDEILSSENAARTVLIIEEPEAFLHPAAQRFFMTKLRKSISQMAAAILTTHSPIIVDEAKFEEVVVVRNQRHFEPVVDDSKRASINTSLLTSATAEILFARTICFVEGEGDRAFFRTLFRRIRASTPNRIEFDGLIFQATGGCTFFAPWLRLARAYTHSGDEVFTPLWIMDGDAAVHNGERPILRLYKECGFHLGSAESECVVRFGDLPWEANNRGLLASNDANRIFGSRGGFLFCCDLEWALFNGAAQVPESIKEPLEAVGVPTNGSALECARRLGSKIGTGKAQDRSQKQPYIRAAIAEHISLTSLPPEIYGAVMHILKGCFGESDASRIAREAGIASAS